MHAMAYAVCNDVRSGESSVIKHVLTLDRDNFTSPAVKAYLDRKFQPELTGKSSITIGDRSMSVDEYLEYLGAEVKSGLPRKLSDRFFYIVEATDSFPYGNYTGRACLAYVWPEFFSSFPGGKIAVFELDESWFHDIWRGQVELSAKEPFKQKYKGHISPQEMSGLQVDLFPFTPFQLTAYGTYPLILLGFRHTLGFLLFVYLPPKPFKHSQLLGNTPFGQILWNLCYILDDQWTFDGSRGFKSETSLKSIAPTSLVDYLVWLSEIVNHRMADLLELANPVEREQLAMTVNRAICDGILAVSTQFPYEAKTFFFNCLDKLANVLLQVGNGHDEVQIWKRLVSVEFIQGDLKRLISQIPGPIGIDCRTTCDWVAKVIAVDEMDPDLLRDIRNTNHGYSLRRGSVDRLFGHSGEINNDLTLLATPLLFYVISIPWRLGSDSTAPGLPSRCS